MGLFEMLIVWIPKLLVVWVISTNTIIQSTNATYPPLKNPILKPPTRDELVRNMRRVSLDMFIDRKTNNRVPSLNVCAPGVNRAALCEAITEIMKLGPMLNKNRPCTHGFAYNAIYECKTQNGIVLQMWSVGLEDNILVAVEKHIAARFNVKVKEVQLLDTDFINYTRFVNWWKLAQRTRDEVLSGLEVAKLTPLYETAAQLHVRKVNPPETIPESIQSSSAGFDICEPQVNRGLLCQAINVRYYGETFWVRNTFQCDEGGSFECSMRNGEILLLRKGNYPYSVFLMDHTDELVHFVAFLTMAKDSLTNKFLQKETITPDPESDKLAFENLYPHKETLLVHDHTSSADLDDMKEYTV